MNVLNNLNRTVQYKHSCIYCGKGYKTCTNLEKHLLLCEMIHKRSSSNISLYEEPIPSQKKMYQLLVELAQKYNRLEEKVNEINKCVIKKKKKIDILEWLNSNVHPTTSFENLSEKISISDYHIEFLCNNSFNDTLNEVLENSVYNTTDFENPIFAFSQNTNMIYIYEKDTRWTKITNEKLARFLNKIQMKISKAFYEWKKIHSKEIKENDSLEQICNKTTGKLMAPDFKSETVLGKIRNMIYNKMKTDVKAVLEYEFEF